MRRAVFAQRHARCYPLLQQMRAMFVDAPLSDFDPATFAQPLPQPDSSATPAEAAAENYTYPLDSARASFKLYGEPDTYANTDANRVFATASRTSYDPDLLYTRIHLQDVGSGPSSASSADAAALHATGAAGGEAGPAGAGTGVALTEEEAEMRAGRDKQGAAGAAAVAAAMLEARRAVDGIAMVPGHPLPVVFPKQDNMPPPLRFVKKFGGPSWPTASRPAAGGRRKTQAAEAEEDSLLGSLVESQRLEGHSLQRNIALQVRVFDERRQTVRVTYFHSFSQFSDALPEVALEGLRRCHFTSPTLVQSAAIPLAAAGKDLLAVAPNGSGRTVCHTVTSLAAIVRARVQADRSGAHPSSSGAVARPLAVLVCPSRDDVLRTSAMYTSIAGGAATTAVLHALEDAKAEEQQTAAVAAAGCDVLIATPARLAAAVSAGAVTLERVRQITVDGADAMLEVREDGAALSMLLATARHYPDPPQCAVWCVVQSEAVRQLCAHHLSADMYTIAVEREERTALAVKQVLYPLPARSERLACVRRLYDHRAVRRREQVLVVCAWREVAEGLRASLLAELKAPPSLIQFAHSGQSARTRRQLLQDFRHGDVRILVATDVALRHVEQLAAQHVVHYDLPPSTDLYRRRVAHVAARSGFSHVLLPADDPRVPLIARYIQAEAGRELSPDIEAMISEMESRGGDEDWGAGPMEAAPVKERTAHIRVRGKRRARLEEPDVGSPSSPTDPSAAPATPGTTKQ